MPVLVDDDGIESDCFLLRDEPLNVINAVELRNLGCPCYAACLAAALAELGRQAMARRSKRKTWKLGSGDRTWVCNPVCPDRHRHSMFHMELLQSPKME
jgi:hypothetical protein